MPSATEEKTVFSFYSTKQNVCSSCVMSRNSFWMASPSFIFDLMPRWAIVYGFINLIIIWEQTYPWPFHQPRQYGNTSRPSRPSIVVAISPIERDAIVPTLGTVSKHNVGKVIHVSRNREKRKNKVGFKKTDLLSLSEVGARGAVVSIQTLQPQNPGLRPISLLNSSIRQKVIFCNFWPFRVFL